MYEPSFGGNRFTYRANSSCNVTRRDETRDTERDRESDEQRLELKGIGCWPLSLGRQCKEIYAIVVHNAYSLLLSSLPLFCPVLTSFDASLLSLSPLSFFARCFSLLSFTGTRREHIHLRGECIWHSFVGTQTQNLLLIKPPKSLDFHYPQTTYLLKPHWETWHDEETEWYKTTPEKGTQYKTNKTQDKMVKKRRMR